MRVLVISDIHSNLTALEAVLADAPEHQAVWCLGDLVGYGPDPNECVSRIRALTNLTCLVGNHDQAVVGWIRLSRFNREAGEAIEWTRRTLKEENVKFLKSLPSQSSEGDFALAHASPREPIWEYVMTPQGALANFDAFDTDYCLIGHSHMALIFQMLEDSSQAVQISPPDGPLDLVPRMILNPGSVGQPRDMDSRAAYSLLDTEALTWEPRRVAYDIVQVQSRIREAGLPERQAQRLEIGW
jgi:predicted phosphodiesterase